MKGMVQAGSAYSEDVTNQVQYEVVTEPVTMADAVNIAFTETAPGKTDEQLFDELVTLIRAYLVFDVIVYGGVRDGYVEARERVKLAIISYLRQIQPSMLEGNLHQLMKKELFPELLDDMIANRMVLDHVFSEALIISSYLKNIDPNDAFEEFTKPNFETFERMTSVIKGNGFDRADAIRVMKSYRKVQLTAN